MNAEMATAGCTVLGTHSGNFGGHALRVHAFEDPLEPWQSELPSFPAPQKSSHIEPEETIVKEQSDHTTAPKVSDHTTALKDIRLNLDERNILPGNVRRQRTKSWRAAGTW
ncbi:hypothetical protein GGX14DRAFT_576158 [Mycena pura]|uniref:Uncharacterized protein n=1 Tax=Mycena pura TaxID=153505 RepID=A0AAD6UU47_9AGAR|nr:hypothetical protein GGX14DRAFT_576158 [Mycena pura]